MKHAVYDANNNIIRPIAQLQVRGDRHLAALIRDDAAISFSVENQHLILHYVDHVIPDLSDIAREFGFIERSRTIETKAELYGILTQRAQGGGNVIIGNVMIFTGEAKKFRAPVSGAVITTAGWTIDEWPASFGYKTLFPQIYSYGNKFAVATPILNDGSVLSKTEFNQHMNTIVSQNDPMAYDVEHDSMILGLADTTHEAEVLIELLEEWENNIITAGIPVSGEGRKYYDSIITAGMANQTEDVETICGSAGITESNVVSVVNTIYPYFNCQPEDTDSAWGRLRKLLFFELWIIVPRRE